MTGVFLGAFLLHHRLPIVDGGKSACRREVLLFLLPFSSNEKGTGDVLMYIKYTLIVQKHISIGGKT